MVLRRRNLINFVLNLISIPHILVEMEAEFVCFSRGSKTNQSRDSRGSRNAFCGSAAPVTGRIHQHLLSIRVLMTTECRSAGFIGDCGLTSVPTVME